MVAAGVIAGVVLIPTHLSAESSKYDQAVGEVVAAFEIYTACKNVGPNGPEDYQGFVFAATDILATQGLRRQRMRALLFYGKTESLDDLKGSALAARGVNPANSKDLCAFGKKVAGQNDTIGQFLVRE
jgi:hypothetical protein